MVHTKKKKTTQVRTTREESIKKRAGRDKERKSVLSDERLQRDTGDVQKKTTEPKEKETIDLGQRITPKSKLEQVGEIVKPAVGIAATVASVGTGAGIVAAAAGALKAKRAIVISKAAFNTVRTKLQARSIAGRAQAASGKNSAINTAFKTNPKSSGLTTSHLSKTGFTIPASAALLSIIGTYPFAGFIKEESLQTLSFAVKTAKDSGDLEGEQEAIDQVNETLNPDAWEKLLNTIPFANVVKQLTNFYQAAAKKNELDQKSLDKRQSQVGQESDFETQRRESDEASFERKRGFADEQSERFEGIRQENEERDAEEATTEQADRDAETERFAGIEADRTQAANEEKRLNSIYFQLLRDKKFAEAEEFRITNFPT